MSLAPTFKNDATITRNTKRILLNIGKSFLKKSNVLVQMAYSLLNVVINIYMLSSLALMTNFCYGKNLSPSNL